MNGDDLERSLGRIEEGIDGLKDRMDRQNKSIYGDGGLESRVRKVEGDMKVVKAVSGFISMFTAGLVSILAAWFRK